MPHEDRGLGDTVEHVQRLVTANEARRRQRLVDRLAHHDRELTADDRRVLAFPSAHLHRVADAGRAPHVQLGRLAGRREPHGVAGIEDRVDLQARRGHGLAVDQQRARVVAMTDRRAAGRPAATPARRA